MPLRLYNTLTRRLEEFVPLDPAGRRVTFYACGPTVYDFAHIGNFRSFLNADVLRRALELLGYEVQQVMNMTDVGHMTDDELADGAGEDKMDVAARRLMEAKKAGTLPPGVDVDPSDPWAIADFYIGAFLADARTLGLKIAFEQVADPFCMPRPTQYIRPMIDLVQTLIDRGHAYVGGDGVVYFDVQSFPEYGQLSGNTPDRIRSGEGGRVAEATQQQKKHPADFMLWKPDPKHKMRWPSPWGEGYPGWHLECSVMAGALLGGQSDGVIDIHSGGEDNIFPHHECEIAQSCCASGQRHFARYWFHTRFLMVEGQKMSKRSGTFHTVRDLVGRGHSPAAIRLELIRTHYRSNANFTFQGLRDSQRQVSRWVRLRCWLQDYANEPQPQPGPGPLESALEAFTSALENDLNVAGAIGALNEASNSHAVDEPPSGSGGNGDGTRTYAQELIALEKMDSVLGVLNLESSASAADMDVEAVERKIAARNEARAARDWASADRLRGELSEMGVAIKDGPSGTTWERMPD